MINHYVLAHKEDANLKKCVNSILHSTNIAQQIIIVYNGRKTNATELFFSDLLSIENINIFYVGFNGFTFGVNLAMRRFQSSSDPYFIVSDGDFIFPESKDDDWLGYFIEFMESYPMVGRVGLGIMLDNLLGKKHLRKILATEKNYLNGFKIGSFYHAPIDTTPALYRKNVFYWGSYMSPGHMTGMKPCFITMRSSKFLGYHLGWDSDKYSVKSPEVCYSNLISFGLFNGAFAHETLNQQNMLKKMTYLGVSVIGRTYWRFFKIFYIIKYVLVNKFVFLNELEKRFDDL